MKLDSFKYGVMCGFCISSVVYSVIFKVYETETRSEKIVSNKSISDEKIRLLEKTVDDTKKEVVKTVIVYRPTGEVKTKIVTRTDIISQAKKDNSIGVDHGFSSSSLDQTKDTTKRSFESNFLVLGSYQISEVPTKFDKKSLYIGFGYRILGGVYLTSSTNLSSVNVGMALKF